MPFTWSEKFSSDLQQAVDTLYENDTESKIKGLNFSFTIAAPLVEGCPLVGCSDGFLELTGYTMEEIIGRNCRFLVDPVPAHLVDDSARLRAREFCKAVAEKREFVMPMEGNETSAPMDGMKECLFCVQVNARKDGSLFHNMFFLKTVNLDDEPYIVGLQSELPEEGGLVMPVLERACRKLDTNMAQVERTLASMFWFSTSMRRQEEPDPDDLFIMGEDAWDAPFPLTVPDDCCPFSNSILKDFLKADSKGAGFIPREELSDVLRSLNPQAWNEDKLAVLMNMADSRGDEKIYYEEFISWLANCENDDSKMGMNFQ